MKNRSQRMAPKQPNHILCRGNNRRRLFSYPRDYLRYLGLLERALRGSPCRLHAFCLMSNHVHLLITPPTARSVSRLMQGVNQRYSQIRNEYNGTTGKLFEQRFESEPVESERHLAYCVLYIDANPHTAGLPGRARYRWSSQAFHAGGPGAEAWSGLITPVHWYSKLGRNHAERTAEYRALFGDYLEGKLDNGFVEKVLIDRMHSMEPQGSLHRPMRPNGSCAREELSKYAEIPGSSK